MGGFVGFANINSKLSDNFNNLDIIKNMINTLTRRVNDEQNFYTDSNIHLGHRRLIDLDSNNRKTAYDLFL